MGTTMNTVNLNSIHINTVDVNKINVANGGGSYSGQQPPSFDPSKLPYQALWVANGKKNSDTDKNVPNLVDANNPLVLSNFLYALDSGYGKYDYDFRTWSKGYSLVTINSSGFTVGAGTIGSAFAVLNVNYTSNIFKTKIKVTNQNLENPLFLRYRSTPYETYMPLHEGVNDIDVSNIDINNWVISFSFEKASGFIDKNIIVEQISQGEGLFMDGVDDSFASKLTLPALSEYTVIGDLAFSSFASSGIGKASNWFWYGNRLYINGTTVSNTYTGKCLGFNSDGLILTENEGAVQGKLSLVAPTETKIASFNSPKMSWGVLAIIKKSLNEQEIRQTHSYLQTLKANNIG